MGLVLGGLKGPSYLSSPPMYAHAHPLSHTPSHFSTQSHSSYTDSFTLATDLLSTVILSIVLQMTLRWREAFLPWQGKSFKWPIRMVRIGNVNLFYFFPISVKACWVWLAHLGYFDSVPSGLGSLESLPGLVVSIETEMAMGQLKERHSQEVQDLKIELETKVDEAFWYARSH